MTATCFVYSTLPDADIARKIAETIVTQRLAACANILSNVQSYYWWEGKVSSAEEVVLIAKTRMELFEPLRARIQFLHPYDCPCIIALPIELGHTAFLDWIKQETHGR